MRGLEQSTSDSTAQGANHARPKAAPRVFPFRGHRTVAEVEASRARIADLRRRKDRTHAVAFLRLAGWKLAAIAEQFGVSAGTVQYHVRKAGLAGSIGRPRKSAQQRPENITNRSSVVHSGEASTR